MKIVRNLPQHLILTHAPWLMGAGLILCLLTLSGVGVALLFRGEWSGLTAIAVAFCVPGLIFALIIVRDQAIFDAGTDTITLQRRTLFRYSRQDFALSDLKHAELEELSDTSRPVLVFHRGPNPGPHPLVRAFVSGNGPRRAVTAINDWHQAWRRNRRPA